MSTLEIACGQCEKRFRVRAEFAGRSTRCPACSASITVGGPVRPVPASRPAPEERPRSRTRPREVDDEPHTLSADWSFVEMAFRREQVAVICLLIGIVLDYFLFCLARATQGEANEWLIALAVIVLAGPVLGAAAFALMARISALKAPPVSRSRGSALASLLCALAAIGCVLLFTMTSLIGMTGGHPAEGPMVVASAGLILAVLASVGTFFGFIVQIGIVRRSAATSAGITRMAIAVSGSTLGLIGIGVLYAIGNELTSRSRYQSHDTFYSIAVGILLPLALAVVLIMYHRLLAAGRRSLTAESPAAD